MSLNVEHKRRRTAPRRHPEQDLQIQIVELWHLIKPRGALMFHVPNGGKRSPVEAAIFKLMGVVPGINDLILAWSGRGFAIEVKVPGSSLEPEQRDVHAEFSAAGWRVETVRSVEGFIGVLRDFGMPLRMSEDELDWHLRRIPSAELGGPNFKRTRAA